MTSDEFFKIIQESTSLDRLTTDQIAKIVENKKEFGLLFTNLMSSFETEKEKNRIVKKLNHLDLIIDAFDGTQNIHALIEEVSPVRVCNIGQPFKLSISEDRPITPIIAVQIYELKSTSERLLEDIFKEINLNLWDIALTQEQYLFLKKNRKQFLADEPGCNLCLFGEDGELYISHFFKYTKKETYNDSIYKKDHEYMFSTKGFVNLFVKK